MAMTRRKGSVAVLALVMVVSTAAVALTMVTLSGAARTKQVRLQKIRIVQNAFDGGIDYVKDMASRGVLRLPQTVNTTIGPVQETLALTDVSSQTISLGGDSVTMSAPTILITGTLTYSGDTYQMQQVIGRGLLSTVWQYALYVHSDTSTLSGVTTGSPGYGGDVWINGNAVLVGLGTHIGGDLTATGLILPPGLAVDGKKTALSKSITFPAVTNAVYLAAAASTYAGLGINGYVFPSANASGYPILYVPGSTSVQGSFTGSGVIYATGDITIGGNITTGVGNHLVIITPGNISVTGAFLGLNLNAYLYCGDTLNINSPSIITGGIVARQISIGSTLASSFDTTVRDNPAEAYKLRLPGVWP